MRLWRWPAYDVAVAAAVAGVTVAGVMVAPPHQPDFRDRDVLAIVLALAQGLPLIDRRHRPLVVLGVVWGATALFLALSYPPVTTSLIPVVVATYALAAGRVPQPPRLRLAVAFVLAASLTAIAVVSTYSATEGMVLFLLLGLAGVSGDRTRARHEYLDRERDAQLAASAAAERTRIARELHDVIAHGVSVIVLHARGAREVLKSDPEATRRSLELIEQTGREALQELRTVLGALRTDGDHESLEPQHRVVDLDTLVERTAAAGLAVDVTIEGTPTPLPSAVDLAAYRVVQEALANAMKHSAAASASLTVRYDAECLVLRVSDDGPARERSDARGARHGLIGMQERVSMLGGSLEAAPRDDGGFDVRAILPVSEGGS